MKAPGLREQFWELARAASDTRDMLKDAATQMADILALASCEGLPVAVWQPITKKGVRYRPFAGSALTEPRGEK